jgi:hypothetical protein
MGFDPIVRLFLVVSTCHILRRIATLRSLPVDLGRIRAFAAGAAINYVITKSFRRGAQRDTAAAT